MKARILLPTFNENSNIEEILRRIFQVLPQADVLVIDDNSPDGTASTVEKLRAEFTNLKLLLRKQREGLGKAYLAGMAASLDDASDDASNGIEALITMDADFSHDPADLPRLIQSGESHDLVIGSRYCAGGDTDGWESWRRALSSGGNTYSRVITGMPIHDVTSGFQLVRTDVLRKLDLNSIGASGYAFQIELKHNLWRAGVRWTEVPIVFHARRGGESKLTGHVVREGIRTPWRLRFFS
jgi:dolichol-phosphate mannosyltransferase